MLWLKSFHLMAMVAWFAGLFYLPRLFVYHAEASDKISRDRFKIMERRLFFGIMTPAAVLTIFFGGWMLYDYAWMAFKHQLWLHMKLAFIAGLLVYHYFCFRWMKSFAQDRNKNTSQYYRWMNEVPTLFLIVIILLAVIRPLEF